MRWTAALRGGDGKSSGIASPRRPPSRSRARALPGGGLRATRNGCSRRFISSGSSLTTGYSTTCLGTVNRSVSAFSGQLRRRHGSFLKIRTIFSRRSGGFLTGRRSKISASSAGDGRFSGLSRTRASRRYLRTTRELKKISFALFRGNSGSGGRSTGDSGEMVPAGETAKINRTAPRNLFAVPFLSGYFSLLILSIRRGRLLSDPETSRSSRSPARGAPHRASSQPFP